MLTELRSVQPGSAWVEKTREELLQKIGGTEVVQAPFGERVALVLKSFIPLSARSAVRGPITAVLSGLGLIIGGSMVGVSAAEQSVPGDLLFPVKLVSEQTRLVLTTDKREKVRLKGEFVNRRVDEIKKIVQTDVGQKPERLKEATEILRRDFDTVKNQLADVSQDKPVDRVEVAKLIDQATTDAVAGLKEAKASLTSDARSQVAEVEAAAVDTSMKAVNVIIHSQTDEDSKKVVTKEELIQSISQKVEGVSDHITSATQQLTDAGILSATGTATAFTASSSAATIGASTSSVADLLSAHVSLAEARVLLSQDRLSEVGDKLVEASKSAANAERSAESIVQSTTSSAQTSNASSTTTSSTPPLTSTSSSSVPLASTTQMATTSPPEQKK
jgi:hypothetical protein